MDHFDIAVSHHVKTMAHGAGRRGNECSERDVVGFLDLDCVPLNREIVSTQHSGRLITRALSVLLSSNHITRRLHIFRPPAFFFLHRAWTALAMPSFVSTRELDVPKSSGYRAEEVGLHYRALYPRTRTSSEGGEDLASGNFASMAGMSSLAASTTFEGRYLINAGLFITRCNQIVAGTFCIDEFQSSSGDSDHRTQPDESLEIKTGRDHRVSLGTSLTGGPPLYRAARSGLRLSREHFPMMHNRGTSLDLDRRANDDSRL